MKASHSSRCPVCGLYVAKNHSHADKLSKAIRPVGLVHYDGYDWRDDRNGERVAMHLRRQVHKRCRAVGEALIEQASANALFAYLEREMS